ncbi:MAG: FAD-binding domain-containing protein, partial [Pseudomonadota bacterium]
PGEDGAKARLKTFLDGPISNYDDHRNRPDLENSTSRLSPHLAHGEINPAQIWRAVQDRIQSGHADEDAAMVFLSEICWRDFSYVLLYHNPDLASENYNTDFNHMPWRYSEADLKAWQRGQTGYPIVDAGMRQLWQTGWMHNRVRMIVASFLTKHLLTHWKNGEDWFWDTLVDSDPASNGASWQWTAGSGADAAPYFRVFNPITQGEKFDETGDYVRQFCPELAKLPNKYLYKPWEADPMTLHNAGVKLGDTFPHPIVEHKEGRQRALDAYDTLKEKRDAA